MLYGHRGLLNKAPENTRLAYEAAVHEGLGGIELDVVQTKDGAVILETTEVAEAQAMLAGTNNILQYVFKEIEPDATVH